MKVVQFSEDSYAILDSNDLRYITTVYEDAIKLSCGEKADRFRICWYSQHDPLIPQVEDLKRLYGDFVLEKDPNPFQTVSEAVKRIRASGADEVVVVAPLSVLSVFCRQGIKPLRADMEEVTEVHEDESPYYGRELTHHRGRIYRHKRFVRVMELKLVTCPIEEENP